ncbi:hypothetical protein NDU88_006002 [Pleurodeles waltl]|uniref:Uncharacterized protein n=1 Tax=Pleurodeles waltl TaxID=8319 RepID=A0AAV7MBN7_PLEWA|nr:hypothetical protein NDU88_006002 [Pleurodeles waltl]
MVAACYRHSGALPTPFLPGGLWYAISCNLDKVMISGKTSTKFSSQLPFSEAVIQHQPLAASQTSPAMELPSAPTCLTQETTMERILQEIKAVNCREEGIDTKTSAQTAKSKSICTNIASFQDRVEAEDQRLIALEDLLSTIQDRGLELLYLRHKLTDLDDHSHREKVCFFGFPGRVEGADVKEFLKGLRPLLVRTHICSSVGALMGLLHGPCASGCTGATAPSYSVLHPSLASATTLVCGPTHGPYNYEGHAIHIADFLCEANKRRKAFLAVRFQLHKISIKFELFNPAMMWISKDRRDEDFCDLDALCLFLDCLAEQVMDLTTMDSETASLPSTRPPAVKSRSPLKLYHTDS